MKYLTDYTQKAQTALIEKTGAFFAFSNKQFTEQLQPDTKYYDFGAGVFVPQKNAKAYVEGLNQIQADGVSADIAENGKKAIIMRELNNFECGYTGDISDCADALHQYAISPDEILEVFNSNRGELA